MSVWCYEKEEMTKDIKEPVEWSSGKTSDWAQVVIDDHICIVNIDISYKHCLLSNVLNSQEDNELPPLLTSGHQNHLKIKKETDD